MMSDYKQPGFEHIVYTADIIAEKPTGGDESFLWARVKPPFAASEDLFAWNEDRGVKLGHYATTYNATVLKVGVQPGWITEENDSHDKRVEQAKNVIGDLLGDLNKIADLDENIWIDT